MAGVYPSDPGELVPAAGGTFTAGSLGTYTVSNSPAPAPSSSPRRWSSPSPTTSSTTSNPPTQSCRSAEPPPRSGTSPVCHGPFKVQKVFPERTRRFASTASSFGRHPGRPSPLPAQAPAHERSEVTDRSPGRRCHWRPLPIRPWGRAARPGRTGRTWPSTGRACSTAGSGRRWWRRPGCPGR
jgi:hypothetical protein